MKTLKLKQTYLVRTVGMGALALAVSAAASCGGGGSSGTVGGTDEEIVIVAPGEGATHYRTESTPGGVIGGIAEAGIARGIEAGAAGASLEADGRLATLASWLAEQLRNGGEEPPLEVTRFFAAHLGIVEPVIHLVPVGQPSPEGLEPGVTDAVAARIERTRYDHYGASVVVRQGLHIAIVMLSARDVHLSPVPRSLPSGGTLALEGRLLNDFLDAELVLLSPSGQRVAESGSPGAEFAFRRALDEDGEWDVALRARGASGRALVARFPVYVGVEPPDRIRLGGEADRGPSEDALSVESEMARAVASARHAEGLDPLELHEGLTEVARAHAQDMVARHYFAHEGPDGTNPSQRVAEAGLGAGIVMENLGRGESGAEIHTRLMASPQHRGNILHRDATHVGIGVARTSDEAGGPRFYAVQVFARMARPIDVAAAPGILLERINEGRTARGATAVEMDPNLQRAASDAVRMWLEDPSLSQRDAIDEASAAVREFAMMFRRVGGVMAVVSDLDEVSQLEPTFDPEVRYVGIGVVQGQRGSGPPNRIAVIVLLGYPR